jgi:hypothetical protein
MFRVTPRGVVWLDTDALSASDDHRRRDFAFVSISRGTTPRLNTLADHQRS